MTKDKPSGRPADSVPRSPRRELLAGAVGALGVIAAETVVKAAPAQAANGDAVLQGVSNGPTTSGTKVFTANNREVAVLASPGGTGAGSLGVYGQGIAVGVQGSGIGVGTGVFGSGGVLNGIGVTGSGGGNGDGVQGSGSGTGDGVFGQGGPQGSSINESGSGMKGHGGGSGPGVSGLGGPNNGTGVHGSAFGSGTGVVGDGGTNGGTGVAGNGGSNSASNNGFGVVGTGGVGNGVGVWGQGQGTGAGVLGTGFGGGPAVHGRADFADAIGVLAENTAGGIALKATGPASFTRSGVLTVRAGTSTVTKTGLALTAASLVLATLQQNRAGVFVQAAVPDVSGSSFTIHLNKTVSASTNVGWFVVN